MRTLLAALLGLLVIACGSEEPRTEPGPQPGPQPGTPKAERPVPTVLKGAPQGVVASGDVEAVKALLDAGRAVDERDEQEATLLHTAAIHGRLGVVRLLLERGASVEARDRARMTPLHAVASMTHWIPPGKRHGMRLFQACGTEHRAVAEALIEKGADIRTRDDIEYTPLHWAAKGGNLEVARLLIERGADVNATDDGGSTPLRLAAMGGNWEPDLPGFTVPGEHAAVAKLLLDHGADPDASSFVGTPLAETARSGASDVAKVLLEHGASTEPREQAGGFGIPPLHAAASEGDTALMQSLFDKGADVEATDRIGRTALFLGAVGGQVEAVRLLLKRGATVSPVDRYGHTALHAAATSGNVKVLELLVARGGDLKAKDEQGNTLLHVAAAGCLAGEAMVVYLVEQGLDINAGNADGRTPLYVAENADCLPFSPPIARAIRSRGGSR